MIRQRLFKFIKKQASRALQEKTDLIIVAVFLIMILFCVIGNAVSQGDDSEAEKDQLEVAGIYYSGLAAVSEGSVEADISKPGGSDLPGVVAAGEIPEENSEIDELPKEPEEEDDIMVKEDNMEKDISLDNKDNHPVIEEEEIIDFSNSDNFKIEVDLKKQIVFVYYKGKIIKEMICSGGVDSSPTPTGEFETTQKIEYDWVDRFNMGAYYWVRFYKSYLFHSVPFDKNGNMKVEEFEKLGSPASHGCVRLELEEAKWLYEKLPLGVKVLIY
jgi:lipoprotein-anchoring transpeptidase ErfK/SrfK